MNRGSCVPMDYVGFGNSGIWPCGSLGVISSDGDGGGIWMTLELERRGRLAFVSCYEVVH